MAIRVSVDTHAIPAGGAVALPAKPYTEKELARIRTRAKAVGWIQGGATVFLGGLLLRMIGWIPAVLIVLVVGYVVFKLLGGGSDDDEV